MAFGVDVCLLWSKLYLSQLCSEVYAAGCGLCDLVWRGHYAYWRRGALLFGERLRLTSMVWIGFILIGIIGLKWSDS